MVVDGVMFRFPVQPPLLQRGNGGALKEENNPGSERFRVLPLPRGTLLPPQFPSAPSQEQVNSIWILFESAHN